MTQVKYKPISRWIKIRWTCPKDESKDPQPYFLFKGKRIYISNYGGDCPIVLRLTYPIWLEEDVNGHLSYLSGYFTLGYGVWEQPKYVELDDGGEYVKVYTILKENKYD